MRCQSALMLSTLPLWERHTTFNEVGSPAGAVSYIHQTINVDSTSIQTDTQQGYRGDKDTR